MSKAHKLTATQLAELQALQAMPDSEIDYSDIPTTTPDQWKGTTVGKFYRPIKQQLTLRLDADVLAWLKGQGKGYQTRINDLLRQAMTKEVSH